MRRKALGFDSAASSSAIYFLSILKRHAFSPGIDLSGNRVNQTPADQFAIKLRCLQAIGLFLICFPKLPTPCRTNSTQLADMLHLHGWCG
jgi:hypothetical protein